MFYKLMPPSLHNLRVICQRCCPQRSIDIPTQEHGNIVFLFDKRNLADRDT